MTAKSLPVFRADCLLKETVPQINTLTGFGIPHCEPRTVLGQFWSRWKKPELELALQLVPKMPLHFNFRTKQEIIISFWFLIKDL